VRPFRLLAFVLLGAAALGAPPAGAQTQPEVGVRIDRADKAGRTPLWIPVRVTVTETDTGRPPSTEHVVFASARNGRGDQAGPFNLGPLELDDPAARGVHEGFVIVPYGGPWTVSVIVNKAVRQPGSPPVVLGRGSAEMTVDAPLPAAGAAGAATAAGLKPDSEPVGVAVLWLHTMVAVLWGIAVALLALLAVPAGRRFLSEYGTTVLDGHLDRITRTVWWLTGLVVATGIYNLVKSVAYRVPLSLEQARRLFRLPYAQPYYLSLTIKLAAYAVMIGATVPLIAEARRRAATAEAEAEARSPGTVDDDRSPWENPQRPQDPDSAPGRVALRRQAAGVVVEERRVGADRAGRRSHGLVAIMALGGVVIMAAVTLLKYFHLLGELSRLSG
jgi:hypothetical protein